MKILILEDEAPAATRLIKLIHQIRSDAEILTTLESVAEARDWFASNPAPDLAFFDIRLADGTCFDLFEVCDVPCPVIFCTAHDEFALQAFKTSGIDYLLKPTNETDISRAFEKLDRLSGTDQRNIVRKVAQGDGFKTRLVVSVGTRLKPVPTSNVIAFFARDKGVAAHLTTGESYFVDYTLTELDEALDPKDFFRISRATIVSAKNVESAQLIDGRWIVHLKDETEPFSVSRQRVKAFQAWLAN